MEGALEFNFGRGHNRNAINFFKVVRCYSDDLFFVFHFVLVSAFRWIFKIEKNYRDITNVKRMFSGTRGEETALVPIPLPKPPPVDSSSDSSDADRVDWFRTHFTCQLGRERPISVKNKFRFIRVHRRHGKRMVFKPVM